VRPIKTDKPYRIFADIIEEGALEQFESAMRQPFVIQGALMPDAHQGYSLPIGAVVATDGFVLPSWVGYDIGCGMCALPTTFAADEVRDCAQGIFASLYEMIPTGFKHNARPTNWAWKDDYPTSPAMKTIFGKDGLHQLGSLGGGNHFIEIGAEDSGKVWFIIHSGSRGIGHATATHYMRLASGDGKAREGHFGFTVGSENGANYIKDLAFCLAFALENRREIMRRIEAVVQTFCTGGGTWCNLINRNHNHAEEKDGMWIHRKGATHAEDGMMGVIPGNMRDGSFIVCGLGNPESLWSSSHGAGRVLGRKEAKRQLDIADFEKTMTGVVAKVTPETIDESPFAYKDIFEVMRLQGEMVKVMGHVKPILNVKA